ncbi:phage portal protein family protein [Maribellus mangrovi]|uniref:phage portal protein family protein n=1 Tax=Maribellus mangrovi TaxID=3133146 RepID=UPI0030EC8665
MAEKKQNTTPNPAQQTIDMMVVRPARIQSEDISSWVEAVNSAKRGYRTKLYNLYENILADPVLSDAIDKRVNAITNAEIAFMKDGQTVEAMDDLIDTPEFEELIREIVLSKAWGKTVADISFNPEFDVFSIPRKHIRIDKMDRPLKERRRFIIEKEGDLTKGYDYENDPYIIECGKDDDLGFIFKAAPYVIYKRGGFGDWAQFAEIFGMPFLVGKYNGYDPKAKQQLFEALSEIGSNPRAAIPKETDLEVKENKSSGSNTLYKDLKDACNEEILIAVLGNLMTTLDGSSRSQSEVHQETQEEIAKNDRRFVRRILNRKLVPLLLKRGYPVAGGYFSFPEQGENTTTDQLIERGIKLKKEADVYVDDDWFYETSGIPKPEKQPEPKPEPKPDPEPEKKPKAKKKKLRNFFAEAPVTELTDSGAINRTLWQRFKRWITGKVELADGYSIDFDKIFAEAIKEVYGGDTSPVNKSLFNLSNDPLQNAFSIEFGKEGDDWGKGNADFIKEFRKNGAEFSGFKAHNLTKDFAELLYDEDGNQLTFKAYKKKCLALKDVEERHLQTQYNTAIKSTRAAINFRKYLANEKLYPNLEYIESIAEHKDLDHLALVGTILPIRDEWWKKNLPPSRWNCQCSVKPTKKPATKVPDEAEPVDPVFANNPGETAKFVVTEETAYYKNTAKKLRATVIALAAMLESLRRQLEEEEEES